MDPLPHRDRPRGGHPVIQVLSQYRSFPRPVRLLLVNQLTINLGFYMLMPYLAAHLSGGLGLAAWLVGLVLGVRNLSQQGMFLFGGALADRFGYKPMIIAGLALRTVGFGLLGFVDSLPALIAASAATGLAGALFNPASRAYLTAESGERRVEAFALFNVFYQVGILIGPLIGLALTGVAFSLTCLVAAVVFAVLTVMQVRELPARSAPGGGGGLLAGVGTAVRNRPFLFFAIAMIGSYVLSFQIYLTLPLQVRAIAGGELAGTIGVGALFAVSGLVAVLGQLRITAWCRSRYGPARCITLGLALMTGAFLPPLLTGLLDPQQQGGLALWLPALLLTTLLLTLGTVVTYPFEMDTIAALSGGRLVATHYGLYSTLSGIGITIGNLVAGRALDLAREAGVPAIPWLTLLALGLLGTVAVHRMDRSGRLTPVPV
ncbi:MFS transporter [Crossiella cryophila]|uniref:MFS family permease n=1 Tax=Crossiella cryophila TaxID=43355 RepID=A0A7W7C7P8_9PSEU|nr:MFS transporter [Crossiella cryophila]MBB4676016.1 MFS family permease [Crossiella cryophila]